MLTDSRKAHIFRGIAARRADLGGALHHLVHGDPVAASKALRLTPKHEYALLNRLNQIRSNPSDPLHAHIQTAEGLKRVVEETAQSGRDFLGRAGGILSRGMRQLLRQADQHELRGTVVKSFLRLGKKERGQRSTGGFHAG